MNNATSVEARLFLLRQFILHLKPLSAPMDKNVHCTVVVTYRCTETKRDYRSSSTTQHIKLVHRATRWGFPCEVPTSRRLGQPRESRERRHDHNKYCTATAQCSKLTSVSTLMSASLRGHATMNTRSSSLLTRNVDANSLMLERKQESDIMT